jgi:hypothetical protein
VRSAAGRTSSASWQSSTLRAGGIRSLGRPQPLAMGVQEGIVLAALVCKLPQSMTEDVPGLSASETSFPRYIYPPRLVAGLSLDWLLARRRSFRADARTCVGRLEPPLCVLGEENIPRSGPCVLTVNHYFRPGFRAEWIALSISAVAPVEVHWIITGELTYPGKWYGWLGRPASRFVLRRLGKAYGFTSMPPMPPRPKDIAARAGAVRATLSYLEKAECPVIGFAPEGGDQPGGRLSWPPAGAGRFGLLLAERGLKYVPVGVYESEGVFCLRFGRAYQLNLPNSLNPAERDRSAARMIMQSIAGQLPARLRGEFG